MENKAGAIVGIDALRFVSAMMVVLFHLGWGINYPNSTPGRIAGGQYFDFPWPLDFFAIGRTGVQIFFVISGFVIAYTAGKGDSFAFFQSRVLRLVPAAWICASITLAFALFFDDRSTTKLVAAWIRSIAFIPFGKYIDGSYWTLGIECSFYAIVIIIMISNMMHHIEKIFLLVATISTLFCVTVLMICPEFNQLIGRRMFELMLLVHGCEFAVGIFLWAICYKGVSTIRVIGLAIGMLGGATEVWHRVPVHGYSVQAVTLWVVAVFCIALSVLANQQIRDTIGDIGVRLLRILGLATYPLYLLHNLVGAAIMRQASDFGLGALASFLFAIFILTGTSCIIAQYIEPIVRASLKPLFNVVANLRQARI